MKRYPCAATSKDGVIDLVVQLVSHGYFFFVQGSTRNNRELSPQEVDERMIKKFEANHPKWTQARRRKLKKASCRYLRLGTDWLLLATDGSGPFFDEHRASKPGGKHQFIDVREIAIKFHGYSIKVVKSKNKRGYSVSVRMQDGCYQYFRDHMVGMAAHRSKENLSKLLYFAPWRAYKPIQQQMEATRRLMNKIRKSMGYEEVPRSAVRQWLGPHVSAFRPVEES